MVGEDLTGNGYHRGIGLEGIALSDFNQLDKKQPIDRRLETRNPFSSALQRCWYFKGISYIMTQR